MVVSDNPFLASVMQYGLSYFDHETCRLESVDNPFAAKVGFPRPDRHFSG